MRVFALLTGASVLAATAAMPALAQPRTIQLNPRDVAEAQKDHAAVLREFGGAETGTRANYVAGIGARVGAYSGVASPGQTLRYTTLNNAVENAFAVPGGYVYITRQLLTLMEDESNLAFVMGHETGHIAARHAQARQRAATQNGILGVVGQLLGSVVGGGLGNLVSQATQQFAQFQQLKYSRSQETEADTLGLRYMVAAGYDPAGASQMLAALGRSDALQARLQGRTNRSVPEWAQTHPLSTTRANATARQAQASGRAGVGLRNRDQFMAQLDGVKVDDDPAQGIIDGVTFTHPDLRLQFSVPQGYQMQNSTDAVMVEGSGGKAMFTAGRPENEGAYIQRAVAELTGGQAQVQLSPIQQTTIGGIPAFYSIGRANTQSGTVDITVMAYKFSNNAWYHFITLSRGGSGAGPFGAMFNSMRRISAAEAAAIKPKIIDVVTVRSGDTVQSLARRMAYRNFQVERFLSINGLAANARLVPGQKVKLVVTGTR